MATAFLMRWYRSSGISGARPKHTNTNRTIKTSTKKRLDESSTHLLIRISIISTN
jgi:hypothetical protein